MVGDAGADLVTGQPGPELDAIDVSGIDWLVLAALPDTALAAVLRRAVEESTSVRDGSGTFIDNAGPG